MLLKHTLKYLGLSVAGKLTVFADEVAAFSGIARRKLRHADKSGTPFEGKYHLDENGWFIADIPKEKYLYVPAQKENEQIFDIRSYGADAKSDFKTNRTAINRAIADASKVGGVVLVTGGEYTCANICLLSNVTLRITKGSALCNISYACDKQENREFHSLPENNTISRNALIYAENAENITIEGPGQLKGNGATYCLPQADSSRFHPLSTFHLKTFIAEHRKRIMMGREHEMTRDFILAVNYCKNVTVRNLEIYEAGSWTCRMEGNENLLFERVVINNNIRVANSDGIDIMGGRNTVIRNCFIATGDDAVCLKTDPGNLPIQQVLVENCELMSLANCFKIGTATCNDISDVTVQDCSFFMPGIAGGYAGIALEATDGGKVSNITVRCIQMEHITAPFLLWLGYRKSGSQLENITLSDITATDCDLPASITGFHTRKETGLVKNVTLKNINATYRKASEKLHIFLKRYAYEGKENLGGYPESTRVSHLYIRSHEGSAYYDLPVYGLFVRNAQDVSVQNFQVQPRPCNRRPLTNLRESELYNIQNSKWE